jgi:sterol desaturase/sphingolipid hydroxylase (fatty acid hydroxylase superfamily)
LCPLDIRGAAAMNAIWYSTLSMTVIVAVRYLAVSGMFAWITAYKRPGYYAGLGQQMRSEIIWSLASAGIYGVPAGIIMWGWQQHGWTRIYTDANTYPLWWMPVSLFVYLALHDTWFYWTHRWMHRPRVFKAIHAVHHASRPPTAWAAMNFHPFEAAVVGLFIPALVFLVPIHAGMLAIVLTIMTVMGVTNHMGWELFPKALVHSTVGHWVITASHHHRHHELYRCNFGLYFRFWDHVCGTDKGISEP